MADATRARAPTFPSTATYDGLCLELVNELLHQHPSGRILYVEPLLGDDLLGKWKYHAALLLDGIVYDAWHPLLRLPPAEYVAAVFGAATWEINPGSDDAEGPFTVPARSGVACAEGR